MNGRSRKRIFSVMFTLVAALTFMLFSSMAVYADDTTYGEDITLTATTITNGITATDAGLTGYDNSIFDLEWFKVSGEGSYAEVTVILKAKVGVVFLDDQARSSAISDLSTDAVYKGQVTLNGMKASFRNTQTDLVMDGTPQNGTKCKKGNPYKYLYLKIMVQRSSGDRPSKDREPEVWAIDLKSKPTKTSYTVGETLDVTGAQITVTTSDYNSKDIDVTSDMVTGFDSTSAGTKTLTITYKGYTATFDVVVNAAAPAANADTPAVTASFRDRSIKKATIRVPATKKVKGVTTTYVALKKNAFHGGYVKTVILPETITKLECKAFSGDKKLRTIKISSKTMTVEKGAFGNIKKSNKQKIKVIVSKNMSKEEFTKLQKALVNEGLKKGNIKRK